MDVLKDTLRDYLKWAKGAGTIADLLAECSRNEMPQFIVTTMLAIQQFIDPTAEPSADAPAETEAAELC
jgi:putative ATP-dependent endonuclease of OLD family